jgi:tetratricopeptide (TPR) repeat protein
MGTDYLYQNDYRQAAKAFQVATQLDPEDADAYFSWGFALGALGQRQEEMKKYELAVRYDPAFGEAYVAWALCLLQLGQQAEAKAKVLEALAVTPETISPMQLMVLKALDLLE